MSAVPLDSRLASLESTTGQLDKRLSDIGSAMSSSFGRVDIRLENLDRRIDGNFKAMIGWMLGQTAVIVGAIAAVAFALRH
jgi:hypothetical protein